MKEKAEGLNSNSKTRSELIGWRRTKIIELKAQGHNQEEIAQILQVSPATITADLHYLRQEAMENVRDYTTRELPIQFKATIVATQKAIKEYWNISQNAHDNREKMQALESYLECHTKLCKMLGYEPELQSIIDNGNGFVNNNNNDPDYRRSHDENAGRHYAEGEWVYPKDYGPYVYHSGPEHLKRCNEKHDITEQQIEEFQTKYYGVTEQDIEEIKARWWVYHSNGNGNGENKQQQEQQLGAQ